RLGRGFYVSNAPVLRKIQAHGTAHQLARKPEPGDYHLDHPRSWRGEMANTIPYDLLRLTGRQQQLVSLGPLPLLAPVANRGRRCTARYGCPFQAELWEQRRLEAPARRALCTSTFGHIRDFRTSLGCRFAADSAISGLRVG